MPVFSPVILLHMTLLDDTTQNREQNGLEKNDLIPPRMPNKWGPITKLRTNS